MILQTGYFESPIGWIEIQSMEEVLFSVSILDKIDTDKTKNNYSSYIIDMTKTQIDEYFKGLRKVFELPMDQTLGTDFQKQVWNEVLQIPFGHTKTYQEIAKSLGSKKKVRAVGMANGHNPWWIVLPCHRVIGIDGSLVGYAGGLWRKKWLLEFESKSKQLSLCL
jgi:methylated-DNA-[protein]-cysteine S-methyltransferase